jgi:predicted DsbA family dithiol-disulfide isomerase
MNLVVYGDFNCPYSCLASARCDSLVEGGVAAVDWRAVEHDPAIPAPGEPVTGDAVATLDHEIAEIRGLLRDGEAFPIRRPPVRPNSAAAVASFAAAPKDRADELRRRLFTALWFDGRDIGAPAVIAELDGKATREAGERATLWREEWLGLAPLVVPMLVLPDGFVARGLEALARLAELTR